MRANGLSESRSWPVSLVFRYRLLQAKLLPLQLTAVMKIISEPPEWVKKPRQSQLSVQLDKLLDTPESEPAV
jgi:hypothetical protein